MFAHMPGTHQLEPDAVSCNKSEGTSKGSEDKVCNLQWREKAETLKLKSDIDRPDPRPSTHILDTLCI
eukprot:288605-Amorphochlora_amoeboformis.AAC.1